MINSFRCLKQFNESRCVCVFYKQGSRKFEHRHILEWGKRISIKFPILTRNTLCNHNLWIMTVSKMSSTTPFLTQNSQRNLTVIASMQIQHIHIHKKLKYIFQKYLFEGVYEPLRFVQRVTYEQSRWFMTKENCTQRFNPGSNMLDKANCERLVVFLFYCILCAHSFDTYGHKTKLFLILQTKGLMSFSFIWIFTHFERLEILKCIWVSTTLYCAISHRGLSLYDSE